MHFNFVSRWHFSVQYHQINTRVADPVVDDLDPDPKLRDYRIRPTKKQSRTGSDQKNTLSCFLKIRYQFKGQFNCNISNTTSLNKKVQFKRDFKSEDTDKRKRLFSKYGSESDLFRITNPYPTHTHKSGWIRIRNPDQYPRPFNVSRCKLQIFNLCIDVL